MRSWIIWYRVEITETNEKIWNENEEKLLSSIYIPLWIWKSFSIGTRSAGNVIDAHLNGLLWKCSQAGSQIIFRWFRICFCDSDVKRSCLMILVIDINEKQKSFVRIELEWEDSIPTFI